MLKAYIKKISLEKIVVFLGLCFLILLHLSLIGKTFVIDGAANIRTAVAGYGDIPLHLTQITKFAYSSPSLNEPIYYGIKLNYPFLINFISGLLLKITNDFSFSVLSPVVFLSITNILLTFLFFKKIIQIYFFSFLSTLVFFLGGGLEGFIFIQKAIINKVSASDFLANLTQTTSSTITKWDAKFPDQNIDFGSPLSLVFLHQRSFFLGFFLFLIFLFFLLRFNEKINYKYLMIGVVILSLMPLSHTHSFLAAAIVIIAFFITLAVFRYYKYLKKIIIFSLCAALVTAPQLLFLLNSKTLLTSSANFFSIRLGWMINPTIGGVTFAPNQFPSVASFSYLNFLWINFGVILPFFLISFVWIIREAIKRN